MKRSTINTPKFSLTKGLSLIEVLVTVVITSIGLMGLVSLQMQAVRATTDSGNRSQAVWVWNDIINRIHANEVASASYIDANPVACAVPAAVCSSYHNGIGVINPTNCTGGQLADWDRYEVACQLRLIPFIGDASRYLPDAQLTITCADGICDDGDPLTISLQWRARTDDEVVTGAVRNANSGLLTLSDTITP
ncbi:MAG: type IV pilus assembly protein PilV [Alphaproteobacteria bacterium]|jgi:type IV pilus assembly protein PilV